MQHMTKGMQWSRSWMATSHFCARRVQMYHGTPSHDQTSLSTSFWTILKGKRTETPSEEKPLTKHVQKTDKSPEELSRVQVLDPHPQPVSTEFWEGEEHQKQLNAWCSRIGVSNLPSSVLVQVVTHKSYRQGLVPHNERFDLLGNGILQYYFIELLHYRFPQLPVDSVQKATETFIGDASLADWARSSGLEHLVRRGLPGTSQNVSTLRRPRIFLSSTEPSASSTTPPADSTMARSLGAPKGVMSKAVRALVGAIYQHQGARSCRHFVLRHLFGRDLVHVPVIPLDQPKRLLTELLVRQGKERPLTRILRESGRYSHEPLFVVGVFSGEQKLAEAHGRSLKEAERNAARSVLIEHYLEEHMQFVLPSDVELEDLARKQSTFTKESVPT